MKDRNFVYMDFAATSAIRPPEVGRAVAEFLEGCGATPGRGGHRLAVDAARTALRCRMALARLVAIPGDPGRISFMLNATHALNTALWGVLGHGDAVVITAYDHNAVLRPTHYLSRERNVDVRMLPGAPDGSIDLEHARQQLQGAKLIVINAASNLLGTLLPIRELTKLAHEAGALVLIDAAQAAGHVPMNVAADEFDIVAFTGHKGLLGPQGTGALWVREGLDIEPLLTGGTGGDSTQRPMPPAFPDRLEAGTPNAPGIAGLLAGIEWVAKRGVAELHDHGSALKARLYDGLSSISGVRLLSPPAPEGVALVTLVPVSMDVPTFATRLDRDFGVLIRAGIHCAPEAHKVLGSMKTGAVRFSLGWCTTEEDVDYAIESVARVVDAGTVVPVTSGN